MIERHRVRRVRRLSGCAALLATSVVSANAGAPPAGALQVTASDTVRTRCLAALSGPAADSQTVAVGIQVYSLGSATGWSVMSGEYARLLSVGLREFLRVPMPLPLGTFEVSVADARRTARTMAGQTVFGSYQATLRRNGRLSNPVASGGVRDETFDAAIIAALVALDSSGLLPAPPSDLIGARMETDVEFVVTGARLPHARVSATAAGDPVAPEPLLHIRIPLRRVTRELRELPGGPALISPRELQTRPGSVRLAFVVAEDGTVDTETVRVIGADAPGFAAAALSLLPHMRFEPLTIAGCKVRALTWMPFAFRPEK